MHRYERLFDLSDKVALVAGGSGAIGGEMARAFAAYGAKVAIASRSHGACSELAAALTAAGSEATP